METGSLRAGEDIFYYVAIYNENYEQPPRPDHVDDRDITSGLYKWDDGPDNMSRRATIIFSGPSNLAAREAQPLAGGRFESPTVIRGLAPNRFAG